MPFKKFLRTIVEAAVRKKEVSMDQLKSTKLSKCLKTFDLLAIGVGSTFGSGIYVLTGQVAKIQAGPAVVLSFLIGAIASMLSGLCYIEFATRVPKAGSAYVYTYVTIGELMAFFTGWNLLLEYSIGAAAIARAFSVYVDALANGAIANGTKEVVGELHIYGLSSNIDFVSTALVLIITILLATGLKKSAILCNILTVFNLSVAVTIIITGLFFVKKENWADFAPYGVHGVLAGASTCFYAFIGFDIIATTAEEAKNPGRSIPVSIIGTIVICFVVYFGISTVITLMVPYHELEANTAVADAFLHVGANWARHLVSAGAGISLLCCTLVSMFPLPRMLYSMAQDGLIFKSLSKVNSKTETPIIATVVAGVFTAILTLLLDVQALVEMLSIGTLLAYTMVDICILKLRYEVKNPNASNDPCPDEQIKYGSQELQDDVRKIGKQNRLVGLAIVLMIVNIIGLCSLIVYGKALNTVVYYFFVSTFIMIIILSGIFLSLQQQNTGLLIFRAPCVPFLPIIAIFSNIFLMLELRRLTWIRLVVWMIIGTFVYYGYGIRRSVAGKHLISVSDESSPLVITNKNTVSVEKPEKLE